MYINDLIVKKLLVKCVNEQLCLRKGHYLPIGTIGSGVQLYMSRKVY